MSSNDYVGFPKSWPISSHSPQCSKIKINDHIISGCRLELETDEASGSPSKSSISISTTTGNEFYGTKYHFVKSSSMLLALIPVHNKSCASPSFDFALIQNWPNITTQFKFKDVIITRTNVSNIRRILNFNNKPVKKCLADERNDQQLRKCSLDDTVNPNSPFSKEFFIAYLKHCTANMENSYYFLQLVKEMEKLFAGIERIHLRQTYSMFKSSYELYRVDDCTWEPCCNHFLYSDSKIYRTEYMNPEILYRIDRCPITFQQKINPDNWFDKKVLHDAIQFSVNRIGEMAPSFFCTFCSATFIGPNASLQTLEHVNKCFPNLEWECTMCSMTFQIRSDFWHTCGGVEKT